MKFPQSRFNQIRPVVYVFRVKQLRLSQPCLCRQFMIACGAGSIALKSHLPFLGDIEGPLELQVRLLVVVDEVGDGVVVAAGEHTRGCVFLLDFRCVSNPVHLE